MLCVQVQLRRGRAGNTVSVQPSPPPSTSSPPVVGDMTKAASAAVTGEEKAAAVVKRIRQLRGRGDAAGKTSSTLATTGKVTAQGDIRTRATQRTRKL